ncbi:RNA polymerase sigma-70 factor [Pseudoflavitalea sp. G-6-1-2]|uniref:RNA polymerase sigma factor n=1 Tax=Pseudoflavitalea sp. G-6-1-2 TaxID=2728841 RepID=UPI00146ECC18|nr:RNA polymerase sigma-70 factor [Pseudoflavitalea sp. G-6-1-2]NML22884.1 RNA polymerase sigma-70 factor [Pseudoflavitalea sp. G-6-1-2]
MTGELHIDLHEKELLNRVAAGDELAFATLFASHRNRVYALAYKLTGVKSGAEDVVQDVFLKLWLRREDLPNIRNFRAYLNTITANLVSNMLRRVAYEYRFLNETIRTDVSQNADGISVSALHELQNKIHKAVSSLSKQQQKIFLLSREQGMKYSAIAELLGISTATVKTHMVDALRNIRAHLSANGIGILITLLLSLSWLLEKINIFLEKRST